MSSKAPDGGSRNLVSVSCRAFLVTGDYRGYSGHDGLG